MPTEFSAQENATVLAHMYGYDPEQLVSVIIITEAETDTGREIQVNKIMRYEEEGEAPAGGQARACELLYILSLLGFASDRIREEAHREIHG